MLALAALFLFLAQVVLATDTNIAPYCVIVGGQIIPVQSNSSLPKKYGGETLYLQSGVSPNHRPPTPKPTPKPKIAITPVPAPAIPAPITVKKPAKEHSSHKTVQSPSSTSDNKSNKDLGDDYGNAKSISDPLEPMNRGTFWFNHQLYHYVFIPLSKTYKFIFPQLVRTGISNFFLNAEYPTRFVNDLLQGKPGRAGLETEKFLYNSTVGVAGIMKPSAKVPWLADLPSTDTDATLAHWKIPSGCYIVWPILGPKSLRDTVGFVGDIALDPVTWLTYGTLGGVAGATTLAVSAPKTTTKTSEKLDTYEALTRTSIDRYSAVRSAYTQNRKKVSEQ